MNVVMPDRVELMRERKRFHRAFIYLLRGYGWIASDKNVEKVKRLYLLKKHKAETSRALTLDELKVARSILQKMTKSEMISFICSHDWFEKKDFEKATIPQQKRIIKVLKYVIGLSDESIVKYIDETIGRPDIILNLTINEADKVIKRAEKWETKKLTGRNL